MNKLTKLLSVFVIAGAMVGAGAAMSGCGHTHTYEDKWSSDANKHWHAATCDHDVKGDEGDHVYDNDQDTDCNVCGYVRTVTPSTVKVTGVTLDKETATINSIGGTVQLTATVAPADATNKKVSWFSDDKAVATVDENGKVTAVGSGTAKITVTTTDGAKAAECTVTVNVPVTGVKVSAENDITEIKEGESVQFSVAVAPDTATDKSVTWSISEGTEFATISAEGLLTSTAAGTVKVTATSVADTSKTDTYTLTVKALFTTDTDGAKVIATKEDFLNFRNFAGLSGTYKLTADIDLAGETLAAPKAVIGTGVTFNGQGHTIANATYADAAAKTGILSVSVEGGTVTNVKFLNCAISSSNETTGIVAGLCEGGTISKVEFNSCSSVTTNNYCGLVFGRNTKAATINVSEITVKNGTYTSSATYGGLLVGDMVKDTTVNFKDLQVDGEFKNCTANGSFIAGRTRDGAIVSIENAVISATMPLVNSIGLFAGNGACASLTLKNILILKADTVSGGVTESGKAVMWQTNKAPKAKTVTNVVTVAGVDVDDLTSATAGTKLPQTGENTVAYLKDTLGFDFTADTGVWMEEGEGGYRLRAGSTNVKSPDATLTMLKLNAGNVKTRFKKGETFNADGLSIMGLYSDGVQLVLKEETGYTVDASAANLNEKGEYTITVKGVEDASKTATYKINVVEETGFKVADEFMTKTYLLNGKLDTANLVVYSVWSDGIEEKLKVEDYTVDTTNCDMTTAGEKSVWIKYGAEGAYEKQTIAVTVIAAKLAVKEGKVTVNVDASSKVANGTEVSGVATFKTVVDAIRFLEACEYDKAVIKEVNVAAGIYKAKITTALDNLTLIGANTATEDKTILNYSAVESTVDIVSGAQYGLNCATLHIKGENFTAKNITIRNDFDYINDNKKEASPQGLALTVEGDKAVVENSHLYGNQDTLYLRKGRTYFYKTLIEGNIDFIFGEATGLAFFEECEIKALTKSTKQESNNGYVTAMKADATNKPDFGYIFYKCKLTDDGKLAEGSMSLGRPWGAKATVAYIECSFSKAYSKLAYDGKAKSRWFDMSGNKPQDADFVEYKSTGDGAIDAAVAGGKILTDAEAANYTKENLFAMTNGKCVWTSPWAGTNEKVAVTVNYGADGTLTVNVDKGVKLTEDFAKEIFAVKGQELKALFTDAACTAAYDYATVISEAKTLYATYEAAKGKEYAYTYGGTNGSEWVEDTAQGKVTSADATPVQAVKLIPDTYLTLNASGSKATLTLTGFTTGSSKASKYVKVEFLDASGNVLKTVEGTTGVDKKDAAITFENNVVEVEGVFVKIRITSNTSGKSVGITSAKIVVE